MKVFLSHLSWYCLHIQMPLEITRSFIQNRDGTYELFKCPKVEVESIAETYGRIEKQPVLRPLELKTFLKVGKLVVSIAHLPLKVTCVYYAVLDFGS